MEHRFPGLSHDYSRQGVRGEQALQQARDNGITLTEEELRAAVIAAERNDFSEITAQHFTDAVETLYYRVKKFLRRFRFGIVLELVDVVAAVIAFILTEDMRTPMILIDRWTPLMLLLLVICWIIDVRLVRYRSKVLAEEEEENRKEIEKITNDA